MPLVKYMCQNWDKPCVLGGGGSSRLPPGNYDSDEVCVHGGGPRGTSECSKCFAMGAGLHLMMQMKHVYQDWDKKCAPDLGLSICTETGIKHVYGDFPWQPR